MSQSGYEQQRGSALEMTDLDFDRRMLSNECDFCKVYSEAVLHTVERIFLENRISYFIKQEDFSLFSFLFSNNKTSCVFRINARDVAMARYLVSGLRGIDIITDSVQEDWSPKAQLAKRGRYANA